VFTEYHLSEESLCGIRFDEAEFASNPLLKTETEDRKKQHHLSAAAFIGLHLHLVSIRRAK